MFRTILRSVVAAIALVALSVSVAKADLRFPGGERTPTSSLRKVRYVLPVLNDVFYRGGGPGGRIPLPSEALNSLCEAGFSSSVYLYGTGMSSPRTVNCRTHDGRSHQMNYETINFKNERAVLTEIYQAALQQRGPVFMHCWNGWHASGEVAAYALIQFCDWSGRDAAGYWADTIVDKRNLPKYGKILARIREFQAYSDLRLPARVQRQICPIH